MLASMKALVPTVVEHPVVDVHTAFCPWLSWPCAFATTGKAESQQARTATTAKNIPADANLVVPFMSFSPQLQGF
jgi:hypothetical protein